MRPLTHLVTVLLSAATVLVMVVGVGVLGPAALGALGAQRATSAPGPDAAEAADDDGERDSTPTTEESSTSSRGVPNLPGDLEPWESSEPGGPGDPPEPGPGGPPAPGNGNTRSEPGNGEQPPAEAETPQASQKPDQRNTDPAPQPEPEPTKLQVGDSGPEVTKLQHRLQELGYWLGGANGTYDHLTRQAVIAFQGAEGLARDGVAGPPVRDALPRAQRPTPVSHHANGIEIDLERQILKVVENGQVRWTLHTSSGTGERYTQPDGDRAVAVTPTGDYVIERRVDGWRESDLGRLYRPAYFVGGIAIHGYHDVPPYPASHGCTRVTMEAIDFLWAQGYVDVGRPVVVH